MSVADWTEGELERFIQDRLKRPGFQSAEGIVGLDKFLTLAGRATRGTANITGTGASSATGNVTHGLTDAQGNAIAPEQVFITTDSGLICAAASSLTTTTFTIQNFTIDGSTYSSMVANYWLAVA